MLEHKILTGILPEDAVELLTAINEVSADGYLLLSTTCAVEAPGKTQYVVLFGKPLAQQPAGQRSGIGFRNGGGPNRKPPNVDQNTTPQPGDTRDNQGSI